MPFLGMKANNESGTMREPQDLFAAPTEANNAPGADDADETASPETFLQELQGLVNQSGTPSAERHYLHDLDQLIGRKSEWIITNGTVLDLSPNAPQPQSGTYLTDLQALTRRPPVASRSDTRSRLAQTLTTFSTYEAAYRRAPAVPQVESEYYEIPADAPCTEIGGATVVELFQPMNCVRVDGYSTAPPTVPASTDEEKEEKTVKLERPKNLACNYLELTAPSCYFTTGYGLRRAPRNTHRFCHHPLYFEDPNLERCGQSDGCCTTALSACHFATMVIFSPYLVTANHPRDCVQALPDCPTCHAFGDDAYWPEWSWKAAAVQTAAVTGLVYIIP